MTRKKRRRKYDEWQKRSIADIQETRMGRREHRNKMNKSVLKMWGSKGRLGYMLRRKWVCWVERCTK